MEDQYGMADLRQYMASRPLFPPIPQPPDLLASHRGLNAAAPHPYDMFIFRSDSPATANTNAAGGGAAASSSCFGGFDSGLHSGGGGDGAGRWPRQETLTLLEIRSRLDPKFKEANQKGPLWDEVSRIMSEEHGYQRSGKKCREKFENLYKYYKKTKEGKAGRQDGKHYRFFRQLEALYGDATNNNNNNNSSASMSEPHLAAAAGNNNYHSHYSNTAALLARSHDAVHHEDTSLSLSNYSEADTTSSEEEGDTDLNEGLGMNDHGVKVKKRGGWKGKIKDFIDAQMKRLMEKQEAWMEKMMSAIEEKERERMMREEEWRKQDAARVEREHKFWASERAWIEARDAALMDALHKLTNKEMGASPSSGESDKGGDIWPECEINRLIQLTTAAMEGKFEQRGMVWEEIAAKMGCFGHERSAAMCKEKWDSINNYVLKCSKKRKDNSKSCNYFQSHGGGGAIYCSTNNNNNNNNNEQENGDHHHNQQNMSLNHDNGGSAAISESCFRYFMGDGYGRIIE